MMNESHGPDTGNLASPDDPEQHRDEGAVLVVDFAVELFEVGTGATFTIGREGDLAIDDNPYLHRRFIELAFAEGLFWVRNVGARLAAHVTDAQGLMRSTLAPGASIPLVFPVTLLTFSAGDTAYELLLTANSAHEYQPQQHRIMPDGEATIAPTRFTETQLLAVLALAEPLLRRAGTGSAEVPSAVDAAKRLGWTQTRFNRKIDNVCDKLDQAGVRGLRGGPGGQAANRRLLLVEYAVTTLLVTAEDLPRLDREATANRDGSGGRRPADDDD